MSEISAIIPASGLGRRLSRGISKAFVPLLGKPLIVFTLRPFELSPSVSEVILVVGEDDIPSAKQILKNYDIKKVKQVVAGGKERQDSVRNGLSSISPDAEIIVIHDGARPLVNSGIIEDSIKAAKDYGAAVAAVPVTDTIKTSTNGLLVESTLDRSKLYAVQTPQTFKREVITAAYERAYADGFYGTDDASLVERIGIPVVLVAGSQENIKVTTPTDLIIAEAILSKRIPCHFQTKVGYGYDVHQLKKGRKLYLGGVEFESEEGLIGHSDADVMLHAIMDAVLGAAGLGDIGKLFPNTDPKYKDIRSTTLLAEVGKLIANEGLAVGNVDVMLLAERPKISARIAEMRSEIAKWLGISPSQVNIKASTSEGLGFVGRGEGIACHAVATVYPSANHGGIPK
ncbi:MAG: 2-C-methyl-D-erythritol 4-phosphate cytidylyltransferase [Armatimonadota bacterium]|nr:2-C-methyl-D-erythritol 4-phosphate cytidylyltransferase [Armatimonadota bacterium]